MHERAGALRLCDKTKVENSCLICVCVCVCLCVCVCVSVCVCVLCVCVSVCVSGRRVGGASRCCCDVFRGFPELHRLSPSSFLF